MPDEPLNNESNMRLVAAAVIRKGDLILVARRDQSQKLPGFWEFPGGKVEPGETVAECIVREIYEELGVVAIAKRVLCTSVFHYDHGSFEIVAVETEVESENFRPQTHDQFDWVLPRQLAGLALLPGDFPIAEVLIEEHNEKF
jgi:8-oxo-dGTP diphosphatase